MPPIAGNARANSGHLPWPPAAFSAAVPTSPVAGSLPHPIKWNPLFAFYRFSLLPRLPLAAPPLPAFSFSLSGAGRPPAASPSSPERRPAAPSSPSASQFHPLPRRRLRFVGKSPETRPRRRQWQQRHCSASGRLCRVSRAPADVATTSLGTVTLSTPLSSPPPCLNLAGTKSSPASSTSPHPAGYCSSLVHRTTSSPSLPASQRQGRPRHRFPSIQTPPRSIIVVSVCSRRRRPVGRPARRLAAPPPSSSSLRRVPCRPRIRAAAAGCPRRLLAGPGRRRRCPLVVPGRRGVRPSVKPFSTVVRVRQVCRCSPVVVFVLASASSSLVPVASRLRPRIAAEVVP
uniref:Cell wall protein-like n=1 Tax=Oryza sativa subsp. indica TaxID=39946 RepID=C8TET0_ORYSI|nr:cell wall protein-like [Oryza sativa Indica Group]BAI39757.1 cell wall protein-like [Oryza sativa Indica Group]